MHRCPDMMSPRPLRRGFTLIETVFAMVIVAVTSIGFMASVVYSARQSAANTDHLYAVHLAGKYAAMIRAGNFAQLGDTNTSATEYESQFLTPVTVRPDPQFPTSTQQYTVTIRFTGWGRVQSATNNGLTATLPTGQQNWVTNEWAGHYVTITGGTGRTQIMRITANTGNTLTVTQDLTGASGTSWTLNPDSTSQFFINDGKTARVQVSWGNGQNFRTVERVVYVRRPAS